MYIDSFSLYIYIYIYMISCMILNFEYHWLPAFPCNARATNLPGRWGRIHDSNSLSLEAKNRRQWILNCQNAIFFWGWGGVLEESQNGLGRSCIAYEVKDAPRHFGNHIIPESFVGCRDMLRAIPMVMSISGTLPARTPIVRPCNTYRSPIFIHNMMWPSLSGYMHAIELKSPQNLETTLKSKFRISEKASWWKKHHPHLAVPTLLHGRKPPKKPMYQVIQWPWFDPKRLEVDTTTPDVFSRSAGLLHIAEVVQCGAIGCGETLMVISAEMEVPNGSRLVAALTAIFKREWDMDVSESSVFFPPNHPF